MGIYAMCKKTKKKNPPYKIRVRPFILFFICAMIVFILPVAFFANCLGHLGFSWFVVIIV